MAIGAAIGAATGVGSLLKILGISTAIGAGSSAAGSISGSVGSKAVGLGAAGPIGFAGGAGYGLGIRSGFEIYYPLVKAGKMTMEEALQHMSDTGGAGDIGANFATDVKNNENSTPTGTIAANVGNLLNPQTVEDRQQRNWQPGGMTLEEVETANITALQLDTLKGELNYLRQQRTALNNALTVMGKYGDNLRLKNNKSFAIYSRNSKVRDKEKAAYQEYKDMMNAELDRVNDAIATLKKDNPGLK